MNITSSNSNISTTHQTSSAKRRQRRKKKSYSHDGGYQRHGKNSHHDLVPQSRKKLKTEKFDMKDGETLNRRDEKTSQSVSMDQEIDGEKRESLYVDKEEPVAATASVNVDKEDPVAADASVNVDREEPAAAADVSMNTSSEELVAADASVNVDKEDPVAADASVNVDKEDPAAASMNGVRSVCASNEEPTAADPSVNTVNEGPSGADVESMVSLEVEAKGKVEVSAELLYNTAAPSPRWSQVSKDAFNDVKFEGNGDEEVMDVYAETLALEKDMSVHGLVIPCGWSWACTCPSITSIYNALRLSVLSLEESVHPNDKSLYVYAPSELHCTVATLSSFKEFESYFSTIDHGKKLEVMNIWRKAIEKQLSILSDCDPSRYINGFTGRISSIDVCTSAVIFEVTLEDGVMEGLRKAVRLAAEDEIFREYEIANGLSPYEMTRLLHIPNIVHSTFIRFRRQPSEHLLLKLCDLAARWSPVDVHISAPVLVHENKPYMHIHRHQTTILPLQPTEVRSPNDKKKDTCEIEPRNEFESETYTSRVSEATPANEIPTSPESSTLTKKSTSKTSSHSTPVSDDSTSSPSSLSNYYTYAGVAMLASFGLYFFFSMRRTLRR